MGLLTWLIVGIIVGIIGALAGGWLAAGAVFNTHNAISDFNLTTLIVAFLGAVIVLYTARLLKSDRIIIVNSPASGPMIWAPKAAAACHPSKKWKMVER